MLYFKLSNGIKINLKVVPNSSRNEICGVIDGAGGKEYLKIKIITQAEDGKANKELIKFLASSFDIKPYDIEILKGLNSREKVIFIKNIQELPNGIIKD